MPFVPFSFETHAFKWLETALDCGIEEKEYWQMTIAELIRAIDSHKRRQHSQAQQKAAFDYLLAETIGKSVARIYSSSNKMPKLYEVYPSLFSSEDIKAQEQAKAAELNALRFRQFVEAHNNKIKGATVKDE